MCVHVYIYMFMDVDILNNRYIHLRTYTGDHKYMLATLAAGPSQACLQDPRRQCELCTSGAEATPPGPRMEGLVAHTKSCPRMSLVHIYRPKVMYGTLSKARYTI